MSSELPFYISTTSSEARRRHNHPQQNNQQTSNKQANTAAQFPHPHSSSHQQQQQQIPQSASYGNFSSLIVPAASNFWNAAHTSIQSFTEQISSDFISATASEERDRLSNSSTPSIVPTDQLIEMPFRDRTSEFRTVAKSCQLRQQPPDGNFQSKKAEREKVLQSSVQFNKLAKRIGRDLGMTCAKMEKLSQLAKNKSIFDDRAGEIEELSMTIKQDITGLNKQIANLQQVATHRPQNELSAKQEQQCQNHSKLVVVGLQSKLASISQTFKNVLEIRTENLKMKRARRERFAQSGAIPASLPPSASNGNMGSLLLHDDMHATSNGGIGGGGSSSFALDMDQLEQHRIQEQATLIDETETYHRSRYTAMESIESSISELGTIFRQLATLVSEQGEMITRIDSNIEETAINVEAAHHELLRYFNNISRNRWLIIKVFGVLMAFFIFFVIFMT